MTTSLREAVERLTASANGENQLTIGRNVFVQMTDLTLVLSALQEAREAINPAAHRTKPMSFKVHGGRRLDLNQHTFAEDTATLTQLSYVGAPARQICGNHPRKATTRDYKKVLRAGRYSGWLRFGPCRYGQEHSRRLTPRLSVNPIAICVSAFHAAAAH